MTGSPIEQLLDAVDRRDVDAAVALFCPEACLLSADGRRANGAQAVQELLGEFLATLRSSSHRITAQWHVDHVWIAEVDASYELLDWLRLDALPRAFVLRGGPDGIRDLRVYGAHERPLEEEGASEQGIRVGTHLIPPL